MESKKQNIAVIMGGTSSEHEVSMNSGRNVSKALVKGGYNVRPVIITRQGEWILTKSWMQPDANLDDIAGISEPVSASEALTSLFESGIDVSFIALHGPGGEDGLIQGFFETAGMPYTGSRVLGNAIGMDKILTKQIFRGEGILTPDYVKADSKAVKEDTSRFVELVEKEFGYPCVPKVSNQGSSKNLGIAHDRDQLMAMLKEFAEAGKEILVEEFIGGKELTCAVIDRVGYDQSLALPPTELVPVESSFFDYHAKYTPGATDEITPARITEIQTAEVQGLAKACHRVLHCSGMSRTDMIMRNNEIFVLEINTIPGLTVTSLIPQAAAVAGISFLELLEIQINWGLNRAGRLRYPNIV